MLTLGVGHQQRDLYLDQGACCPPQVCYPISLDRQVWRDKGDQTPLPSQYLSLAIGRLGSNRIMDVVPNTFGDLYWPNCAQSFITYFAPQKSLPTSLVLFLSGRLAHAFTSLQVLISDKRTHHYFAHLHAFPSIGKGSVAIRDWVLASGILPIFHIGVALLDT